MPAPSDNADELIKVYRRFVRAFAYQRRPRLIRFSDLARLPFDVGREQTSAIERLVLQKALDRLHMRAQALSPEDLGRLMSRLQAWLSERAELEVRRESRERWLAGEAKAVTEFIFPPAPLLHQPTPQCHQVTEFLSRVLSAFEQRQCMSRLVIGADGLYARWLSHGDKKFTHQHRIEFLVGVEDLAEAAPDLGLAADLPFVLPRLGGFAEICSHSPRVVVYPCDLKAARARD